MKFVYVHHGNRKIMKTPNENDNLTLLGKKDCTLVAKLLNNPDVKQNAKVIFTAPNLRCRKTAQIINRHIKLPIIEDALLNEFDKKHILLRACCEGKPSITTQDNKKTITVANKTYVFA